MQKLPERPDKGKVLSRQFCVSLLLGKSPAIALNFNNQVIVHISQIPYQGSHIFEEESSGEGRNISVFPAVSNKSVKANNSTSLVRAVTTQRKHRTAEGLQTVTKKKDLTTIFYPEIRGQKNCPYL